MDTPDPVYRALIVGRPLPQKGSSPGQGAAEGRTRLRNSARGECPHSTRSGGIRTSLAGTGAGSKDRLPQAARASAPTISAQGVADLGRPTRLTGAIGVNSASG